MSHEDALPMWIVYDHPSDYPDGFIARLHMIARGGPIITDETLEGGTLEDVREQIPYGLTCMTRSEDDDPVIVETWF